MKRLALWILCLGSFIACDNTEQESPSIDNSCTLYRPFQENWKVAYQEHYLQAQHCAQRASILKAETDSLVALGDSFALYVQFILLANIDPVVGIYNEEPAPEAYQYLVASSKRGYWGAIQSLAVIKDRFGQQKTGVSAVDNFYRYGELFLQNEVHVDTILIEELIEAYGWSKDVAGRQAVLVPLAFARYYLQQHYQDLSFSPLYHIDDKKQLYPFVDDPVYKWATQLAERDAAQHLFSQKAVLAIMNRSPEMKAINNAVEKGERPDGAEFRTLLIF
ncbi:MAG: hypothetical protein ACRBFS_12305 [Aureispira sp.]